MTRINVVPVELLLDQHLLAEYRELPMVNASLLRSLDSPTWHPRRIPQNYTLNAGHVTFFYNKAQWLTKRWYLLIAELKLRGYAIDPVGRCVSFAMFKAVPQTRWQPDATAYRINARRILSRFREKPHWYELDGQPVNPDAYKQLLQVEYAKLTRRCR